MPIASLKSILEPALLDGYGVLALNVFDELTMRTAIHVAAERQAPLIVQTSVKTVKSVGARYLSGMFTMIASNSPTPVALHLDHCPDRAVVTECINHGWNSLLFDASHLSLADATEQTTEVVAEAHAAGVDVEGEIEGIQGVEDDIGSDSEPDLYPIDAVVDFITVTGIDCFAPAIGNAHGQYKSVPKLNTPRVRDLAAKTSLPMALHGGSGLSPEQFDDLITAGCPKVNISTALKRAFIDSHRTYLTENTRASEPLKLLSHVQDEVAKCVAAHIDLFRSTGTAP